MIASQVFHDGTPCPIQPEEKQENSSKPGSPCLNIGPNLSFILSGNQPMAAVELLFFFLKNCLVDVGNLCVH